MGRRDSKGRLFEARIGDIQKMLLVTVRSLIAFHAFSVTVYSVRNGQ
jgi:hypothetical protein